MWRDQAMKVCGYDYIEKDVKEYEVVRDNLFLQDSDDYQNVKYGTAHCLGSANVTSEDTATLLTPDKLDLRSLFSGNTRSGETKSKTRFHMGW